MEIIPGAAYLSLSETRILYGYAGFSTRGKTVLRDPGTNHILEYDDEIPTDLILLYAPGDEVLQLEREWIHPTRMIRRQGVVTEIYRSKYV